MRVLLASTAGAGHFGPLVPFAHAIRRAGHEIHVAAPISAQARVERAGLPSSRSTRGGPMSSCASRASSHPPSPRKRARSRSRASAPFLLTVEELTVRAAAPAVDDLRRWAGLEPDPAGKRLSGSPYLTLTPSSLELEASAGGEASGRDRGVPEPAPTLRFHDAPPPLRAVRSASAPPLVYMSFGSVAATIGFFPGLYRSVIDALAELPIRLVVTVGDAADPAALGPLPANVRVERWIPQATIFTEADAMVGHGGFGTTLGALLAGVPQAIVPLFADQPYNARRIAELGAGLAADAQDPAGVRAAVERLLAEPAFRVAAGRLALEAQGLPSIDEAPAALQALAAGARRRRAA